MHNTDGFDLSSLSDPECHQAELEVSGYPQDFLQRCLESMLLIREVEKKLAIARREGIIGGPVHLGVGQEAVAVGVSQLLNNSDRVFGAHRSHSHLIALGSDIRRLFAEILGKNTGHCGGMGGSMHLWDESVGFAGSVPIVAGTVAIAVGAAMAARMQQSGGVAVAYFGDGACEEGVVHEALNLASIQKEPIVFVVENNLFASHMHISKRQPFNSTSRFSVANGIPFQAVDGNNLLAVHDAAKKMILRCRNGDGPGFIEAVTYRWYGHVDWRDDIDVGVNRSKKDVLEWRKRDPIAKLYKGMITAKFLSLNEQKALEESVAAEVEECWLKALADPYPPASALVSRVFCK